jgi:hypothetical protein
MIQPELSAPIEARKQCWACDEVWIPYAYGYCDSCWGRLTEVEQQIVVLSLQSGFGGAIRMAATYHIKNLLRPPPKPYTRVIAPKAKRTLPPIDLNLEDLEL